MASQTTNELHAIFQVHRAACIHRETVVEEQGVRRGGLQVQSAAIDRGGATDELLSVQIQGAIECLGHAGGAAEAAADIEGFAA